MNHSILEAISSDGSEWEVVVMEEGQSKNPAPFNFFYSVKALESLVPLVEGTKAFAYEFKGKIRDLLDHLPERVREFMPKGLSKNVVGIFKNARIDTIKRNGKSKKAVLATFIPTDNKLKENLLNAWAKGIKNLFGFSIDGEGPAATNGFVEALGRMAPIVNKITKLNEVTVVTEGAAASGHQFLRLLNSNITYNKLREIIMKDAFLNVISQKAPHLLKDKKAEELTDEDVQKLFESIMEEKTDSKKEQLKEVKGLQELMTLLEKGDFDGAKAFIEKVKVNPVDFGYAEATKDSVAQVLESLLETHKKLS